MRNSKVSQEEDKLIQQKLQEAFGYTDEQLAAQLDQAAAEYAAHPELNLTPPKGEFEKILAMAAQDETQDKFWERDAGNGQIIFNNVDAISEADSLEKAYEEIENQLGISGPRLFYNPSELVYKKLIIKDGMARIDFSYGDKYLYYQQMSKGVANSIGYNSDRELYKSIHNRFLNNEINVYRNELETGNIEFNAQYINENTVFYLVGNIDEKVFDKIVKNLSYVENEGYKR